MATSRCGLEPRRDRTPSPPASCAGWLCRALRRTGRSPARGNRGPRGACRRREPPITITTHGRAETPEHPIGYQRSRRCRRLVVSAVLVFRPGAAASATRAVETGPLKSARKGDPRPTKSSDASAKRDATPPTAAAPDADAPQRTSSISKRSQSGNPPDGRHVDPEAFRQTIWPPLRRTTNAQLQNATGLSEHYLPDSPRQPHPTSPPLGGVGARRPRHCRGTRQ